MNYLVRNSIKLSLIASALLVFSACGSDEPGNSNSPKIIKPLFDQQPIEAGDVCEFGGTMVRGGLDKDDDGELSDDEVTSKTPVCLTEDEASAGPSLLVKTEILEVGDADCADGGKRVHVGYDLDGDGQLSAEEIADEKTKTTELCNSGPIDACVGADQLEIVSIALQEDLFGYHEVDRPYEVRIEFNHEIDTASLELKDILKTLGEDALAYSVDPNNPKVAILVFEADAPANAYAMAISANDGCTTGSGGLLTPQFHSKAPRLDVSYDADGFTAAGDKVKLCYETRSADQCTTTIRSVIDSAAPTSGCIEITADAADITAEAVPVKIVCKDTQKPGVPAVQHQKMLPTVPTLFSFNSREFPGLSSAGEINLYWESFRMESCKLSDGTTSADVPVNKTSHTVEVEETTEFVLSCEDADGNQHSQTRRITVGPGILRFDAFMTQRAPGFPLQFNASWESSLLYGTCDVKFEYASTVVTTNNIVQYLDYQLSPKYRRGIVNSNQPNPAENIDSQIQGTATLTCRSNDTTVPPQSLSVSIRQY